MRHARQRAVEERASCWQRRRELSDGWRDDELQREWRRRAESGEPAPLPEADGDAPPPHIWPEMDDGGHDRADADVRLDDGDR